MGAPHLLASVVKTKRQRLELSARQASEQARLSPSYVARLERGEIAPGGITLATFGALASVLQLTEAEVLFVIRSAAAQHLSQTVEPATGTDG